MNYVLRFLFFIKRNVQNVKRKAQNVKRFSKMEVLALVGVPYFLFKIVNIPFSDLGYPSVDLGGEQVFSSTFCW